MTRPFRFGVVAPLTTDLPTWRDRVRRIADSGYSTLLMPDVPQWQPAPGPTLAVAAALANLRVGTWVYASPLRPPWMTAWEAHSLSVLTDGRFELGVGTGRPGIEDELRERGLPVVPPGERLAQVRETVRALRDLDGPSLRTPVVMAVRGPKARALAAEVADTVTFAQLPGESRAEIARLARDFRAMRDAELANHVSFVGDTRAPFMAPPDADPAALRAVDSLAVLPDDPAAAAEEIQRRREENGFSYFVVGADAADALAPVVSKLAGRLVSYSIPEMPGRGRWPGSRRHVADLDGRPRTATGSIPATASLYLARPTLLGHRLGQPDSGRLQQRPKLGSKSMAT
jgi:alkanesulfonate monooxygenase SsuD/methylene tetrahydromethanopterin reductase-like flavin-dependent oxidoreductase (luciferase family)